MDQIWFEVDNKIQKCSPLQTLCISHIIIIRRTGLHYLTADRQVMTIRLTAHSVKCILLLNLCKLNPLSHGHSYVIDVNLIDAF